MLDFDNIYVRAARNRQVYKIVSVPLTARLYRRAYYPDGNWEYQTSLRKKWLQKTILWKSAAHLVIGANFPRSYGYANYINDEGQVKQFKYNAKNPTSLHFYERDRAIGYEPEVCVLLDAFTAPNVNFFDIGANSGFFSGYIASTRGFKGKIYSFEPTPKVFKELRSFLHNAGIEDVVTAYPYALSDVEGHGRMQMKDRIHTGEAFLKADLRGKTEIRVLDDFLADKTNAPAIIKIDVEGNEANVITGGKKGIGSVRPVIIFENYIDPNFGPVSMKDNTIQSLQAMDYNFFQPVWLSNEPSGDTVVQYRMPQTVDQRLALIPFDPNLRHEGNPKINVLALPMEKSSDMLEDRFTPVHWPHGAKPQKLNPSFHIKLG